MIDVLDVLAGVTGGLTLIGLLVRTVVRAEDRASAVRVLEIRMDRGDREGVRSLMICRGHLLPKAVHDGAQSWLIDRDAEAPR